MSLALISNSFLEDKTAKIRAKPVSWEGYQRAGLISSEELALIKRLDRQSRAKVENILLSDGQQYAHLFIALLKKVATLDTLQYLLVLIADTLAGHEERLPLFMKTAETDPDMPYGPLFKALENQDEFAQLKALQILTFFLSAEGSSLPPHYIQPFLKTVASLVQGPNSNGRDVAVQCLESLLPRAEFRSAVWSQSRIVLGLVEILESNVSPQMTYQVGFCLWLFSFDTEIARTINKKYDIISVLGTIAKTAVKEKVIRVIVATLRNLVIKAPSENLPAMLVPALQLAPFLKNLVSRKWSDDEIIEDLNVLVEELDRARQSLSTYDEYVSELASGHLSWSPVHESETFWKENATKLNEKDYEQLKVLINLLRTSTDAVVLAVAAHDLGQYVKYYDDGKKGVDKLDGKRRVMELMTHEDANVRFQALVTTQRLVSHAWAA